MLDIAKLAGVLLVVCLIAGLSIAFTNQQTIEKIELQKLRAEEQALHVVFPAGTTIQKQKRTESLPDDYWEATKDGNLVGYAFRGSSKGYSGDIKFIAGIDPNGSILGLTILSQSETPGLGTRVQEVVSDLFIWNGLLKKKVQDNPWFTKQFTKIAVTKDIKLDKSDEWFKLTDKEKQLLLDKNTITAITGATISTQAVCSGIKKEAYAYLSALTKQADNINNKSFNDHETQNTETEQ